MTSFVHIKQTDKKALSCFSFDFVIISQAPTIIHFLCYFCLISDKTKYYISQITITFHRFKWLSMRLTDKMKLFPEIDTHTHIKKLDMLIPSQIASTAQMHLFHFHFFVRNLACECRYQNNNYFSNTFQCIYLTICMRHHILHTKNLKTTEPETMDYFTHFAAITRARGAFMNDYVNELGFSVIFREQSLKHCSRIS